MSSPNSQRLNWQCAHRTRLYSKTSQGIKIYTFRRSVVVCAFQTKLTLKCFCSLQARWRLQTLFKVPQVTTLRAMMAFSCTQVAGCFSMITIQSKSTCSSAVKSPNSTSTQSTATLVRPIPQQASSFQNSNRRRTGSSKANVHEHHFAVFKQRIISSKKMKSRRSPYNSRQAEINEDLSLEGTKLNYRN